MSFTYSKVSAFLGNLGLMLQKSWCGSGQWGQLGRSSFRGMQSALELKRMRFPGDLLGAAALESTKLAWDNW